MAFARVHSAQVDLLSGKIVSVEIDISKGLNDFTLVGLPDRAVDEAGDRVGSALKNSGFESPLSKNQKTVISLSPADLKKEGSQFDLPIAVGYLLCDGLPMRDISKALFAGELGLDGSVRSVRGMLPIALAARANGFSELYVPAENAAEAAVIKDISVYPVQTLREIVEHLIEHPLSRGVEEEYVEHRIEPYIPSENDGKTRENSTDFSDIVGQESAKRGLLIAASGGHNILMYGPPGTGKTMLARAFAGILPALSEAAAMEVASIHSIAGVSKNRIGTNEPPFRSPHHTASYVSVIGGGATIRPGEVTLAHRGVLFLDEFPEFDRRVIESLREPLEDRVVSISRAKGSATFPAQFMFVAAMNPCPCGYKGSKTKQCSCTASDLVRYRRKLSGPLMDRIDLAIHVGEIEYGKLAQGGGEPESEALRVVVENARARAYARLSSESFPPKLNGELKAKDIPRFARLSKDAETLLNSSAEKLGLSARAYHRTQKLARTIADLAGSEDVLSEHVLEAVRYRPQFEA